MSPHGIGHWSRVWNHGRMLSDACWDSDRLDLARVVIRPDPLRLCTEPARRRSTIDEAVRMATRRARVARASRGGPKVP